MKAFIEFHVIIIYNKIHIVKKTQAYVYCNIQRSFRNIDDHFLQFSYLFIYLLKMITAPLSWGPEITVCRTFPL